MKNVIVNSGTRGANLSDADLRGADLSVADLRGANLSDAYLIGANLSYANLRGANLSDANLIGANLSGADLRGANLSDANLIGANLSGIIINETTFGIAMNCPEDGSFIGWKKCKNDVVVKLLITEDAKRSSATTYKCRASKVKVLEIIGAETAFSNYDESFIYKVGDVIEVTDFDGNRWNECSTGIHFFMSRQMAENYR